MVPRFHSCLFLNVPTHRKELFWLLFFLMLPGLLCMSNITSEGRSEGAGALPAAAARKPRMGRRGLPATDNRKRLPRRLTPSRQLCVRSRPCPWSQSWGPEGPRGGASALRCRRIPSPGVGRYVVWEAHGHHTLAGRGEARPPASGGMRPHCPPSAGSVSDEILASEFRTSSA